MGMVFIQYVLATRTFISRRKLVSSRSTACSSRYVDNGQTPHTLRAASLMFEEQVSGNPALLFPGAVLATAFSASAS
jgi:hypothetical protein